MPTADLSKKSQPPRTVGEAIRARRVDLGLTLEELAIAIGTDKGTMSRLERDAASIDTERLQLIARELDVEPGELFPRVN